MKGVVQQHYHSILFLMKKFDAVAGRSCYKIVWIDGRKTMVMAIGK